MVKIDTYTANVFDGIWTPTKFAVSKYMKTQYHFLNYKGALELADQFGLEIMSLVSFGSFLMKKGKSDTKIVT